MDILNSEKMTFKVEHIPLHTVGGPKKQIKALAVNTVVILGMTEQINDGYLDWTEEEQQAEQCMLVETDAWFKQRHGCLITPANWDVAGKNIARFQAIYRASYSTRRCGNGQHGWKLSEEGSN